MTLACLVIGQGQKSRSNLCNASLVESESENGFFRILPLTEVERLGHAVGMLLADWFLIVQVITYAGIAASVGRAFNRVCLFVCLSAL